MTLTSNLQSFERQMAAQYNKIEELTNAISQTRAYKFQSIKQTFNSVMTVPITVHLSSTVAETTRQARNVFMVAVYKT